jgi:hypothetical protein
MRISVFVSKEKCKTLHYGYVHYEIAETCILAPGHVGKHRCGDGHTYGPLLVLNASGRWRVSYE